LPAQEMAEGIILAVSGALLLTPGFVTDAVGFAGLIPPIRRAVAVALLSRMVVAGVNTGSPMGARRQQGDIIDGESWDASEHKKSPDDEIKKL